MNPVQSQIRAHIDAHLDGWRTRTEDPVPTRSGPRYHAVHVAALLAPVLADVGLRVHEAILRTFVTVEGRQITRERLGDLIAGALDDHPDAALRASVTSPGFFEHLAYRVPEYLGEEITRPGSDRPERATTATERSRLRRIREERPETASALAFLAAIARRFPGERILGADLYRSAVVNIDKRAGEAITPEDDRSEFWTVPRRRVLFEVAGWVFVRRRASGGTVFVVPEETEEVLRRIAVEVASLSLSPEIVEALSASGIEDHPDDYADVVVARIGPAGKRPALDPALFEIADALPFPVASAVASSDAPRRALGLMGREWLRRHPEDGEAVSAAAGAFGEDLVEAVRWRVASAIEGRP